ncbi:MAG: hypothetical protein H0U24_07055 [Thermoleophilaceae bacterium]|nr:hypothetical protein [Thermoleophilaceae bacterium]
MHGTNPHGQGTVATQDAPPSTLRPLPPDTAGGNGEILVAGRSRGEQNADGSYRGHITIAALLGNELVGVDTTNGQTKAGPLDAVQQGILTPLCNATTQGICLTALTANSATTPTGSNNKFSAATAAVGGPTGVNAGIASSNGNINQDANCQTARGDSNVANASVGGPTGLAADAIEATSTSQECKSGTTQQTNTSKVVNLRGAGVAVPPLISQACANGTPDSPALVNILLPAVCNADESNSAQAGPVNGIREGLTTFVLDIGGNALLKTTTGASESRAVMKPQCSDGKDNDGDGKIDFPADPGCSSALDDDETDAKKSATKAACEDGEDNDGDGKVDFPDDPGCSSRKDDSEENADKAACEDGRDNDGYGRGDFPDDPGCSSRKDDSEENGGGGSAGASAADNPGDRKSLAFTGTNLLLTLLIGSLVLLVGLGLRSLVGRDRLAPGRRSA